MTYCSKSPTRSVCCNEGTGSPAHAAPSKSRLHLMLCFEGLLHALATLAWVMSPPEGALLPSFASGREDANKHRARQRFARVVVYCFGVMLTTFVGQSDRAHEHLRSTAVDLLLTQLRNAESWFCAACQYFDVKVDKPSYSPTVLGAVCWHCVAIYVDNHSDCYLRPVGDGSSTQRIGREGGVSDRGGPRKVDLVE
eukprot:1180798-Amphidinium_carterae.1